MRRQHRFSSDLANSGFIGAVQHACQVTKTAASAAELVVASAGSQLAKKSLEKQMLWPTWNATNYRF